MGHILLGNVSLIGSIVDDHRPGLVGIIHPLLKLRFRDRGTGRVIGETQVNDIRRLLRQLRRKICLRRTGHVDHVAPCLRRRIISPGPARHHVGVHIDRIHRVADRDLVVDTKNLLDISGITLGSVGNEYLVGGDIASPRLVILLRHGAA